MIPPGTRVYFGAPASPMDREFSDLIRKFVSEAAPHGIAEAHLPLTLIENFMETPEQVLILIGRSETELHSAMNEVGRALHECLPPDRSVAILPMLSTDTLLASVREARCRIYPLE